MRPGGRGAGMRTFITPVSGTPARFGDPPWRCWGPPGLTPVSFAPPVPLIRTMESRIMIPLKISPLQ